MNTKLKILLCLILVGGFACNTEKNTLVSRAYHNLTAHYNAYFNGKESFKEGVKKVETTYKDNYTVILPVFVYGDEAMSKSIAPEMDNAIKKASKVIKLHSITARPKSKTDGGTKTKRQREFYKKPDYCNWVDDSYMLMGKSYFYKKDYFNAAENFQYVVKKFSEEPTKYHGMLWLVRNYNEMGQYDKSKELLEQLDGDRKFPAKLNKQMAAIYADYYLKQKKYEDAIPKLLEAISATKKRKVRARYKYILAQIYQQMGDGLKASKLYADVIKLGPPYEMEFNAKINRATSYDASSGDSREIRRQLLKMSKDEKNKDYLDQIYFALANIEYKEKNEDKAIEYYKMSAFYSSTNQNQKALSYLAMADIYFGKRDYKNAQAYYDSCGSFLSADYPGYEKISLKTRNLNDLVESLNTIYFEDSVQTIAKMSEKDRFAVIDKIINKLKEDEQKEKEEEQQRLRDAAMFNQNQGNKNFNNQNSAGKWYFYNQSTVALGMTEFKRKWGSRKLEDNWRRKNKAIANMDMASDDSEQGAASDTAKKSLSNKSREYYLIDLPVTDSLLSASTAKIVDAYYNAGIVYYEKLRDYDESVKTFEELNKRYPQNIYLLSVYYYLYRMNKDNNNPQRAEYYKNLIVSKFPDSNYTKMLTNPNYLAEIQSKENEAGTFYEETYSEYKKNNYPKVVEKCDEAISTFKDNKLLTKFLFLKAVSVGKSDAPSMKAALTDLVKKYPNDEVKAPAQNILDYMNKAAQAASDTAKPGEEILSAEDEKALEIFSVDEKAPHFYVVIVENKKTDVNRLKFNLVNFNLDFYSMVEFNVSAMLLNDDFQVVTVKTLDNKEQAMNYFNAIKYNKDVYSKMKETDYRHFVISSDNFTVFYSDKDIGKYMKFFRKNYLAK